MNRNKLVVKSGVINLVSQMVMIIISFINRKLFIDYIGIEYLGLNSVIGEVLSMLALTELGIETSIIYRLYAPLSQHNFELVNEIITLLKKIYRIIGVLIAVLGIVLMPFLKFLIKGVDIGWNTIYIAYILLLISSVITYFLAYKRTLLYADQKQYITVQFDTWINIAFSIVRIISIFVFKNYYIFIFLNIIQNIVSNLMIHRYCGRHYKWLDMHSKTSEKIKKDLIKDTKNVFAGKVASYIYSSTDNLVISSVINTVLVGYMGNYKSIITSITGVITSCMAPMQPIVGNYLAIESKEDSYKLFNNYTFIRYTILTILLVPTWALIDIFVKTWYGAEFLLPEIITVLLIADLYIACVHGPTGEYINALGYFKYDKYVYYVGALINLVVSIVGAMVWGLQGVLIGTVISQLVMWIGRSYIIYSKYFFEFKNGYLNYGIKQVLYVVIFVLQYLLNTQFINIIKSSSDIVGFILKGIVSLIVAIIIHLLIFYKTNEMKYVLNIVKLFIVKKK